MIFPEELFELVKIFNKPIYLVGGFVRDSFLKICKNEEDIDIAAGFDPSENKVLLEKSGFELIGKNTELGVFLIKKNGKTFEFARFRKEKYNNGENHRPSEVVFTEDLFEDAKRRDFSINAIYYDIKNKNFIDPFGGKKDILSKTIKTTLEPETVFSVDPIRILRMIRFAGVLGFDIDKSTFENAKRFCFKLAHLSKEWKYKEFIKIIRADDVYKFRGTNFYPEIKGLKLLAESGALKMICPELDNVYSSSPKLFKKLIDLFKYTKSDHRMLSICYVLLKAKMCNFESSEKLKNQVITGFYNSFGRPKSECEKAGSIISCVGFNSFNQLSEAEIRKFIVKNHNIIKEVIEFLFALYKSKLEEISVDGIKAIKQTYQIMTQEQYPFAVEDLDIGGDELKANFPKLRNEKIAFVMNELFELCISQPLYNKKTKLIEFAQKIILSNSNLLEE